LRESAWTDFGRTIIRIPLENFATTPVRFTFRGRTKVSLLATPQA
jgi:hypothetical protein